MRPYKVCAGCGCYVRRADAACPFCGAVCGRKVACCARAPDASRVSRAQWLAFGSAAVLGCSGGSSGATVKDATASIETGSAVDAAGAAVGADAGQGDADVAADASMAAEAASPGFTPGVGSFVCLSGSREVWQFDSGGGFVAVPLDAAVTCDRATQYCFHLGGPSSLPEGCQAYDASFAAITPHCDGGLRRCSCVTFNCSASGCENDDAGGLTVTCGECYGAPPARLERLRRRQEVA